jgi:hypothetical protein
MKQITGFRVGEFEFVPTKMKDVVRVSTHHYRVGQFSFEPHDGDDLEYISDLIHQAIAYYNAYTADSGTEMLEG